MAGFAEASKPTKRSTSAVSKPTMRAPSGLCIRGLRISRCSSSNSANAASASSADRTQAFETWQKAMNSSGPFVPVVQPGQYVVTSTSITSVPLNPVWTVDLAAIK